MKWSMIAFVTCLIFVTNVNSDIELEKPLIDYFTLEYLSVEQSLWASINGHNDPQIIFARIVDEHERFFNDDFGETASLRHLYVPITAIVLENLQRLTGTFQAAQNLLRISRNDSVLAEDAVDAFGRDFLITSLKNSDNIYREVSRPQFWNKGKNYFDFCKNGTALITVESEFHLVYNYYKDVRSALLKGYILTQLSYMLLTVKNIGSGSYNQQALDVRDQFNTRTEQIRRNIKILLEMTSRETWNCDPRPAQNAIAYDQVTNFLQGYIDNELNFNVEDTCTNNCADYTKTKNIHCADKTMCAENQRQRDLTVCNGDVYDCQEMDSIDIDVCHINDPIRRYHHLRYSNGEITGLKPSQDEPCAAQPKARSWRRWFVKCSSCFCLCDDKTNSERNFSLHEVVSDIQQNKVVTGVRIVKVNGIFQFAISQRTLFPYGQTDGREQNTWKMADYQFSVHDKGPIDGVDYFTLTHENRAINLDDLTVPQGKVVTGIQFFHQNGHIIIQIRATDFDYFSGRLINLNYSPWVRNLDGGQNEIELKRRGYPLDAMLDVNLPTPLKSNAFVTFGPTDLETDVSQLTVPFIETLPLESKNPVVLAGIGLVHKGQDGSGGVIAPKLICYEFPIVDPTPEDKFDYID